MIQQSSKNNKNSVKLEDLPVYDLDNMMEDETGKTIAKGGVACPFPWRLHVCLEAVENEGLEDIISWQPHGRSFTVFQPKKFAELVMPRFFTCNRFASFQRQLNIYGFHRFQHGKDKGGYWNEYFVRSNRPLVRKMKRIKIKGSQKNQGQGNTPKEPDFYNLLWISNRDSSSSLLGEEAPAKLVSPVVSRPLCECKSPFPANLFRSKSMPFPSYLCLPPVGPLNLTKSILEAAIATVTDDDDLSLLEESFFGNSSMDDSSRVDAADDISLLDGSSIEEALDILDPGSKSFDLEATALLEPTPLACECCHRMTLVDPIHNLYRL